MKKLKPLRPLYKALYYLLVAIAMVLVRILYPIRTIGRKNIKGCRGFVLAPNHISSIDPLFVILARGFGRKMLIMGKEELYKISPILNFFWAVAGMFPVNRGTGDRNAVDEAVSEVKAGGGLLIFPEGTRSKNGKLGRLKSGAFVVAMEAEAVLVPCIVHYKSGRRPKPFRRTTIAFGKPLTLDELGLTGEYTVAKLRAGKDKYADVLQALRSEHNLPAPPETAYLEKK